MQHQIDEGYTKAMMQFVKLAAKWGAKPVKTTGKHLKFRDALGNQISAPKTSSDFRAIRNFKSELKNRGFIEQEKVQKVKQALEKVKTTEIVPTRATSGQQTTFKDFSQKYQKDKPVRPELVRRMERGYVQSIKDLPLRIKSEIGDKIIKGLMREQNIPRIVRGVSYGLKYAGKHPVPFVTTHPALTLLRNKAKQTMPKSATAVIGIGAGKALYDYVLKPLAQQRRKEQEERRTQLIPSGNQPYGTGRVATLKKESNELVENKYRYAAKLLQKAGINSVDDLRRAVGTIKRQAADRVISDIQTNANRPLRTGRTVALQRRMRAAYDKNKDLAPGLFENLDEALLPSLVRGAARQVLKNKALQKVVTNQPAKQLEFTKLFHGTTQKVSNAINKGGWRGDVNVTRQYTGAGMVNAAPDSMVAKSYAFDRAAKRNDLPFVRTFRVPKSVADKNMTTLHSGAGDYTGKGYKTTILTPQQANKYDITQKVDTSGVLDTKLSLNKSQRQELSQRVRRALRNRKAREIMRRDIKQGNEDSLNNLYRQRNNPQNPDTLENELRRRR